MNNSQILLDKKNAVAVITLNRPDKLNAFTGEMAIQLQEKLDECASNSQIRCIYLTGAGKAFSAGQDLSEVTGPDMRGFKNILEEYYNPIIKRIRKIEKPIVAAVNGVAAGAGANIALCCDVVVASSSASFIQAFSKIGLIPDSGGTYFLPRLIGWQKASALMMLGDKLSAKEAVDCGMIFKVFEDEEFASASMGLAERLSQMPTKGLALTKQALNSSFTNSLDEQLEAENVGQQKAGATDDYQEGVNAFIEKRQAKFSGK
ncbi:MAG: 2-(1,2-epoxy-1,2-dihydrophenyl)acetyl-CoA isomerase [Bacteroidetes bacterium]|nr:MAG: 2-(1,2-epoxy-1,2-dihydrophenyl)acetyl-CoA isomerase [Bacteroidota bacterium]